MAERARITAIAGVNGAGKSSVAGEELRSEGGEYFNPDEVTRRFLAASSSMELAEANAQAWQEGKKRLEEAIRDRADFTFETTLGGSTITNLLLKALDENLEVAVLYVGLESPELHVARVQSRVSAGGHHIPEDKIYARYTSSMKNLVRLARRLTELRVFDNSSDGDPKDGAAPRPVELLYAREGRIERRCDLSTCPAWAKPVFAELMRQGPPVSG